MCPCCGYIDQTTVESYAASVVRFHCSRCDCTTSQPLEELRGKLNWKFDCAARWKIFGIDAEPFNKLYMEPQTGSFTIARALSQRFFGAEPVAPLYYGLIKMENKYSLQLIDALPRGILRQMLVDNPAADLKLTRELVITIASRFEVLPGMTYLDFVKQLLPMWLLTPDKLTWYQRELVKHGIAFKKTFLHSEVNLHLPKRQDIESEDVEVLRSLHGLLLQALALRESSDSSIEEQAADFQANMLQAFNALGAQKGAVLKRLRIMLGQQKGMAAASILLLLPLDYVRLLDFVLQLHIQVQDSVAPKLGQLPVEPPPQAV